eukprot:205536-Prorocentrum_minimum.AAC.1
MTPQREPSVPSLYDRARRYFTEATAPPSSRLRGGKRPCFLRLRRVTRASTRSRVATRFWRRRRESAYKQRTARKYGGNGYARERKYLKRR